MGNGMRFVLAAALGMAFAGGLAAQTEQTQSAQTPAPIVNTSNRPRTPGEAVDRIIMREHQEVSALRHYSPIVETYIQDMRWDPQLGPVPEKDHYFLGVADLSRGVMDRSMLPDTNTSWKHKLNPFKGVTSFLGNSYVPVGFLQMIFVDPIDFDKQHYQFAYVRNEFLGSVRCMVFNVTPLPKSGDGRFEGRIWVETQDYTIVRFNGVFLPISSIAENNLHFDSWRTNAASNQWIPSYIYSAESDLNDFPFGHVRYRSQTRLWGYDPKLGSHESEFSQLTVEAAKPVADEADSSNGTDEDWQREGEDNVIDALQHNGLLAPSGPVDKVMDTVVNNMEVTNNLDVEPEVRCRVLLTSTLEAFTIGHTIVVSRGLLDVLPDEASLAAILAHQLGAVLTGWPLRDAYSFNDTTMISTAETMKRMSFRSSEASEELAAKKAIELLRNSPYKDQLATAGLFLKQLAAEQKNLPSLISANLGNHVFMAAQLIQAAPPLQPTKADQITALPLGSRIVVNSWNDSLEMAKTKPAEMLSAQAKKPFEIAAFLPYLARYQQDAPRVATGVAAATDVAKQNPK